MWKSLAVAAARIWTWTLRRRPCVCRHTTENCYLVVLHMPSCRMLACGIFARVNASLVYLCRRRTSLYLFSQVSTHGRSGDGYSVRIGMKFDSTTHRRISLIYQKYPSYLFSGMQRSRCRGGCLPTVTIVCVTVRRRQTICGDAQGWSDCRCCMAFKNIYFCNVVHQGRLSFFPPCDSLVSSSLINLFYLLRSTLCLPRYECDEYSNSKQVGKPGC